MPLIIISGLPSSGKTSRAIELEKYFEGRGKQVHLVSENKAIAKAGFEKNEFFASSPKEKIVRADLKSDALRLLNNEDVVILDAGNYIKGYRYELYCASKAVRTTQCTLFCGIQKAKAWRFNQRRNTDASENVNAEVEDLPTMGTDDSAAYTEEIFESLCLRFEEPHGNNRWDSPLFTVFPEDPLDVVGINDALFENKPPPPNKSTQCAPLSATTYLFELDRQTNEIVMAIVAARKLGSTGDVVVRPNLVCKVPVEVNASQLNRLRRQFLSYNKVQLGGGTDLDAVSQLFVKFINSNFIK